MRRAKRSSWNVCEEIQGIQRLKWCECTCVWVWKVDSMPASCRIYGRTHRAQCAGLKNTTDCATQRLSGSCSNNCKCNSSSSSISWAFNHAININDNLLPIRWLLRPRGVYFICLPMSKYIKRISWRIWRAHFSPDITADFPAGHQWVINVPVSAPIRPLLTPAWIWIWIWLWA